MILIIIYWNNLRAWPHRKLVFSFPQQTYQLLGSFFRFPIRNTSVDRSVKGKMCRKMFQMRARPFEYYRTDVTVLKRQGSLLFQRAVRLEIIDKQYYCITLRIIFNNRLFTHQRWLGRLTLYVITLVYIKDIYRTFNSICYHIDSTWEHRIVVKRELFANKQISTRSLRRHYLPFYTVL